MHLGSDGSKDPRRALFSAAATPVWRRDENGGFHNQFPQIVHLMHSERQIMPWYFQNPSTCHLHSLQIGLTSQQHKFNC